MEFTELLAKRRSIRRFKQDEIPLDSLKQLVEAAALAPSARNDLPLRYVLVREKKLLKAVFEETAWGGNVRPHRNPAFGETAPTAFLAVCAPGKPDAPPTQNVVADTGAAIQTILLRAVELGLGACWLGAFSRKNVSAILELNHETVVYLIGLGYPGEAPELQRIHAGDSTKYYLDGNDVIHVPKYCVEDILTIR